MKIPSNLGWGGVGLNDALPAIIKGLLAPKVSVLAGAAANTAITVPNMLDGSTPVIISAVMYTAGVPSVVAAAAQGDGTIKIATDTTGNTVVLTWFDDAYGA